MKRRFSVEPIVAVLKQVREFKRLAEEKARLKKLVAGLSLDKAVLQDVLSEKVPGPRSWRLWPTWRGATATVSAGLVP